MKNKNLGIDYCPSIVVCLFVFFMCLALNTPSLLVHLCSFPTRTSGASAPSSGFRANVFQCKNHCTCSQTSRNTSVLMDFCFIGKEEKGQVQEEPLFREGRIKRVPPGNITGCCLSGEADFAIRRLSSPVSSRLHISTNAHPHKHVHNASC